MSLSPIHHPIDAAAACLAVCSEQFGDRAGVRRWMAQKWPSGPISTSQVAEVAGKEGFVARVVRCGASELPAIERPAIVQWDAGLAVIGSLSPDGSARIFEPGQGWRIAKRAELSSRIGTTAVELRPAPSFEAGQTRSDLRISSLFRWTNLIRNAAAQALVLTVLVQINAIVAPLYMQSVVDSVIGGGRLDLLTILAMAFVLLAVFNALATALRNLSLQRLTSIIGWDMSRAVFHHLLRLPVSWFETRRLTDVLSRVQSVDQIRSFLATALSGSVIDGLLCITMSAMMFLISPLLAATAIVFTAVLIGVRVATVPVVMRYTARSIDATALEQGKRIENLRSIKTLKIMTAERARELDWANKLSQAILASQDSAAVTTWIGAVQALISTLASVTIVFLGAKAVIAGQMTVGVLLAFIAYQTQFAARAGSVLDLLISWRTLELHKARVGDIVLSRPEQDFPSSPQAADAEQIFRLVGVCFSYPGSPDPVLRDLELEVTRGDFIAITGPSGAGKSTLMKLLCGLYSPTAGDIYIDGRRVSTGDARSLREDLGVVLQDDDLLSGSILENVSFFAAEPDRDWAMHCLKMARIDEEVRRLPAGVHTTLGDLGSTLSGGQRQRLMLARALYRRPKILLLDEATAHLDAEKEQLINTTLSGLNMTRIIVAHRAETIAAADRVLELRDGRLRLIRGEPSYVRAGR